MNAWKPLTDAGVARRRAELLERARRYFGARGVLAVTTPALVRYAAPDPNIESLGVRSQPGKDGFLHTSPEVCMKRLLAAGYPDIYSICRVFRDGEAGPRHQPEFTLAEWYRLGFDLAAIIDDTVGFIAACLGLPALVETAEHLEYAGALERFAGLDPFTAGADEILRRATDDRRLRSAIGDDRNAALDLLMADVVTPQFAPDRLTVVRHYPASQAALARLCPDDERVADRFEIFCGSLELANGYVELTDADEQRARIETEIAARERSGRSSLLVDETLLAALAAGLPPCAGVAVGIERLHMVLDQAEDIRDVITFATETT